jgi:hypothetical protein
MTLRLEELLGIIREYDGGDNLGSHIGAFGGGRPDDSGERGGMHRPRLSRGEDYPYDEDDPDGMYGQPGPYDRGSGGRGPSHAQLTPSHSAWEELGEILGYPALLSKAYQGSQIGHATGIPGADGGWSNDPSKPWDEDQIDYDDLETYGEGYLDMTLDPKVPQPEPVPNAQPSYPHDQTDDGIETKVDRIFGRDDNPDSEEEFGKMVPSPTIFVVGTASPNSMGVGSGLRTSRGLYGLIPKESAWDQLQKFFAEKN